ncbi:hypothetical protein CPB83DRAFT_851928 [Crepidotus variabilis]|uniref:Uncharacterized protein n=1 Tax=Crepidotus variabilis TaxID=179855 RepID=A0A9P6EIF8_9AGAR|nr:hypothetical protein CPB83DRAFT_851928 [Crepidotus variabilis]
MTSEIAAQINPRVTDSHLRSPLSRLGDTRKPVSLKGFAHEDEFLELIENIERLGEEFKNLDAEAIRYRWRVRDGLTILYLPQPMASTLSHFIFMLFLQDPSLFSPKGPLEIGGSVRTRLFFGDGYQDPDYSLYSSESTCTTEPVVVFHVALDESRKDVGLMAVDWLAGTESANVAICITVDVDKECSL